MFSNSVDKVVKQFDKMVKDLQNLQDFHLGQYDVFNTLAEEATIKAKEQLTESQRAKSIAEKIEALIR